MYNQKKICFINVYFIIPVAILLTLTACNKSIESNNNTASAIISGTQAATITTSSKPNIIFILADDVGYEIPTYTGGQSYETPNIDKLARRGMQFTNCYATPNCSPSRVELLSGEYNNRNYVDWGIYNTNQKTFVSYLKSRAYQTCVAGKWQLDGGDASVHAMGFDKYLIHYPYTTGPDKNDDWNRYKNPVLYSNGAYLPATQTKDKYADDMFADYISSFIDSNKTKPFFIYYSLSLCHFPFCPTPDDPEFANWNPADHRSNSKFFPSMVKYMDKKVGQIVNKVKAAGLEDNTYIFFSGDNGTNSLITSMWRGQSITGGKNRSTGYGTHVPLLVYCPAKIAGHVVQDALVDYSDLFKTITEMAGMSKYVISRGDAVDSKSFYAYLNGGTPDSVRAWSFCYWKPDSDIPVQNKHFVQNTFYKLYDSTGKNAFYNIGIDSLERHPLPNASLTPAEKAIKTQFQQVLVSMQ